MRELNDEQLKKLSREGHLFLSLAEMKAIQSYFREQGREPTDIELETLAQTWSEHCVHKTLKSAVEVVDETGRTLRQYGNLIKETIFESTMELMKGSTNKRAIRAFCLSVFTDNAGVIAFDETDAVCFKVETHNHPSAIEPYGGSATGVGGVIRDMLGTGLGGQSRSRIRMCSVSRIPDGRVQGQGARSVRFQNGTRSDSPQGRHSPQANPPASRRRRSRLRQPHGHSDGQRRRLFRRRYLGNPLVFCGCVGLIPRDKIEKAKAGDAIVVMGGRTGRDGIHGATFSSAELTDTHADEFSHAVQIGNAITEKKVADVILQARDRGCSPPSPIAARADCPAPSARWARRSARLSIWTKCR